jgi:predicted nucleic acid-binding protein
MVDEFVDLLSNSEESLVESMRSGHPAYDFFYLTLARRRGGILVTMNKKMNMLAVQNGIEIVE